MLLAPADSLLVLLGTTQFQPFQPARGLACKTCSNLSVHLLAFLSLLGMEHRGRVSWHWYQGLPLLKGDGPSSAVTCLQCCTLTQPCRADTKR